MSSPVILSADQFAADHGAPSAPTPESGLREWIRGHQAGLWRYLRLLGATPDEADDLQQETFLAVLQRYADRSEDVRAKLLRTVARSLLCDRRRADRRRSLVEWSDAVDAWLAVRPAELEDARITELRTCLAALPERSRQALELHHIQGRDLADVGARLGLRENGIKALLQRSRDLLRECIARQLSRGADQ